MPKTFQKISFAKKKIRKHFFLTLKDFCEKKVLPEKKYAKKIFAETILTKKILKEKNFAKKENLPKKKFTKTKQDNLRGL